MNENKKTEMTYSINVVQFYLLLKNRQFDNHKQMIRLLERSWNDDQESTMKIINYLRCHKKGLGKKKPFYICCIWLKLNKPLTYLLNIRNIVKYSGYYKDIVEICNICIRNHLNCALEINILIRQLIYDIFNLRYGYYDLISHCAKWCPSEKKNKSFFKLFVREFFNYEFIGEWNSIKQEFLKKHNYQKYKTYRCEIIAPLRKNLAITEHFISLPQSQIDKKDVSKYKLTKNSIRKYKYFWNRHKIHTMRFSMDDIISVDMLSKFGYMKRFLFDLRIKTHDVEYWWDKIIQEHNKKIELHNTSILIDTNLLNLQYSSIQTILTVCMFILYSKKLTHNSIYHFTPELKALDFDINDTLEKNFRKIRTINSVQTFSYCQLKKYFDVFLTNNVCPDIPSLFLFFTNKSVESIRQYDLNYYNYFLDNKKGSSPTIIIWNLNQVVAQPVFLGNDKLNRTIYYIQGDASYYFQCVTDKQCNYNTVLNTMIYQDIHDFETTISSNE